MESGDSVILSFEHLEHLRTLRGGYTSATIKALGLTWPLRSGWRRRLVGTSIPRALYDSLTAHRTSGSIAKSALFQSIDDATPRIEGILHFDGACWPNPGPSSCAYVLLVGSRRFAKRVDLGFGTNNTAEYNGIIAGMNEALRQGVTRLEVYGDSKIVIEGVRKMRPWSKGKPHLEALKADAQALVRKFAHGVDLNWVPREQNAEADALADCAVL